MTQVMAHPNAPIAELAVPARWVVVDGWAYWADGHALLRAPLDALGDITWSAAAPAPTTNEVADIIADRIRTLCTLIDFTQRPDVADQR